MKVEIVFPLNVSDSSYYRNLVDHPPEGVEYVTNIKSGLIGNTIKRGVFRILKTSVRKLSTSFALSRALYGKGVKSNPDVEHYAHCIPKHITKNFIVDIEGVWQLSVGKMNNKTEKVILDTLSSDKCKAILPWTGHAYNEFVDLFPELAHKTIMLRPAVPLKVRIKKRNETFTMLYTARDFKLKNGLLACEILNGVVEFFKPKGINVKAYVIANVSKRFKKKYPFITFMNLMTKNELNAYYEKADVFVYPSPIDTFGFSIIEAMSYGVPTIAMKTVDTKSVKEIIVNNFNGFYYSKNEYITNSTKTLCEMIMQKEYTERLQSNCILSMVNGPYNVENRNIKLKGILDQCTTK